MRVAIHVPVLLDDFLAAHADGAFVLPELVAVVGGADHHQQLGASEAQQVDQVESVRDGGGAGRDGELGEDVAARPEDPGYHSQDHGDFEEAFECFDQAAGGEDALQAAEGVELVEGRRQGLEREHHARLGETDEEADDGSRAHDRHEGFGGR